MDRRVYRGQFKDWTDVLCEFAAPITDEPRAVFASYDYDGDGGGDATVIYRRDRAFWVIEGGHCSCHGLEGQWEPTRHTMRDMKKMLTAERGFFYRHREELTEWLKA